MKKPIHLLIEAAVVAGTTAMCIQTAAAQSSYDIVAVDTHTGAISHISKISNGDEFNPAWSPNGKQVAHDVIGGPASDYGQSIFITDVKTKESHPLEGGEGGNDADWSPDGTTIAFDLDWWTIISVPATGGTRTVIRFDAISPDWSPDGSRLAFHQQSDGSIRTINVTTHEETFVTYGDQPVWSPNGQYIAYNFNGGIWKIRVNEVGVPLEGPVEVLGRGGNPTWSNESKYLAFHDWPMNGPDIFKMSADGTGVSFLSGRTGGFETGDYDPSWSNNGQLVAYASYAAPDDYEVPVDEKPLQNSPNPFSESTIVHFTLPSAQSIEVSIYNLLGERIIVLAEGDFDAGLHELQWDGKGADGTRLQNGIYLCRLKAASVTETIRVKLIH